MQYEYSLRRSTRAKYLSLRITRDHKLEVVIPPCATERQALRFLNQNHDWIDRHAHLIKSEQEQHRLIESIDLKYLSQIMTIRYQKTLDKRVRLRELFGDMLLFTGPIQDMRCCHRLLERWLKLEATKILIPLLEEYSNETGFVYRRVSIRSQKSRWGSCSEDGDISLNANLLLKSPEFVRYVLIHELCHLREMNHSKKFWTLVKRFVPDYKTLKAESINA